MSKRAFTITEVIVSVVIVSVVGMALLKISANNTQLIAYISDKENLVSSLTFLPQNLELNNTTSKQEFDVYSQIGSYAVASEELKSKLQNKKYVVEVVDEEPIDIYYELLKKEEFANEFNIEDLPRIIVTLKRIYINDGQKSVSLFRLYMTEEEKENLF